MKLEALRLPKNHLLILQLGTFSYLVLAAIKGHWSGDFWQHAAVVKQFSHSYIETHPILNIDAYHPFYSPYLFVIGYLVKLLGISVIQALMIVGLINAALLLYFFPKFVETIFDNKKIAFYSLLFALFFWFRPYEYSGFISINGLSYVIPYPSTFALMLTFALFIMIESEKANFIPRYIILTISTGLIIITHPLTGMITCLGLFFIHLNKYRITFPKHWGIFALSMIIALSLAFLWPYYSFLDLIRGAGEVFHESNKTMYTTPLVNTFPAVLAIPFIALTWLKNKEHKSLIYLFIALLLIYIYGFFSEKWSFGRVLSFIAIICQIYLAKAFVELKEWLDAKYQTKWPIYILLLIAFGLFSYRNLNLNYFIPLNQWGITEQKYQALSVYLFEEDIVFATEDESFPLPSFGPKIVSCYPQAFIGDGGKVRKQDTEFFFFDENCADSDRWEMVEKYEINKILLRVDFKTNDELNNWLLKHTTIIFQDTNFVLYKMNTNEYGQNQPDNPRF